MLGHGWCVHQELRSLWSSVLGRDSWVCGAAAGQGPHLEKRFSYRADVERGDSNDSSQRQRRSNKWQ
jgi:hypothetical protein